MSIRIGLYTDPNLAYNVKYRNAYSYPDLFNQTAVEIGNFSNLNLFCDNSVEIAIPRTEGSTSQNYEFMSNVNVISITFGAWKVFGLISDWSYINDTNVSISYTVDAYTSARTSGVITEAYGICERTNLTPSSMLVNIQSEPFSPSDQMVANPDLTLSINRSIMDFEGVAPSSNGLSNETTRYVLTVSPAVMEYLGNPAPFSEPSPGFAQELQPRGSLEFYGSDLTLHSGSTFRGNPLVFSSRGNLSNFIKRLLGGCGFRTTMGPSGWSTQQADQYQQYLVNSTESGGQVEIRSKSSTSDSMEAIRFITTADIYNCYCIPANFAVNQTYYFASTVEVTGFKSLGNLHPWGSENQAKNKLLNYPYNYNRVVTANGDSYNIIPQTHWFNTDGANPQVTARLHLRFIGGDTPRLMGMFGFRKDEVSSPYALNVCNDWFTIRNYPAVTLSINDSFNQQVQKDVANTRKTAAIYNNSRMSQQLSNPIKQGYLDTVNGTSKTNTAQSTFNRAGGGIGGLIGNFDLAVSGGEATRRFQDKSELAAWNEYRSSEAGNFISPEQTVIMGNDFLSQISQPPVAAFDCGATDAEFFTFSRYLEEFGASCNCYLNPITNVGNLFNGNATVGAVNGKTFYQFSNIRITGNMPIQWRYQIKSLFESGVYLL